ncbi:nitroreductase family deazaflavin-dependent oxidoreductase [Actinoplanes sp. NPDC051513]|uniref:nitroreductase family deazaflavin-dependent oxidoreductase n=1 Tax=Actinoplanes sp. NPDC051513 TaxID=3363908 RepID=UPI0037B18203
MIPDDAGPLATLDRRADHRDVERALLAAGWTACGAGDWAIALRSPDGTAAARISPFDPTGPYAAALYREAAHTRQVPRLFEHRRLAGGGDLQVMEWLRRVPEAEAGAFQRAIARASGEVAELAGIIREVHERARRELPWCGPLDHNPANVMRTADRRLVVTDLFYADGPDLYRAAATDPDRVVARIPQHERRFMTDIPLASTGPWEPGEKEAMRAALAAADERRRTMDVKDVNKRVIEQFRAGGEIEGMHRDRLLLLTTTGARTGNAHTTPMMFHRDGERLLVIASNAGAPADPDWYRNLVAHPAVRVEIGDKTYAATATPLTGDDRSREWAAITEAYPFFVDHEAKAGRDIPVVELTAAA